MFLCRHLNLKNNKKKTTTEGGSVKILSEKLTWNKQARTDTFAKDYRPGGII